MPVMSFEESAQNSYNQYFDWNMKLHRYILMLCFFLTSVSFYTYPNDSSQATPTASASLEFGADSLQRRYFGPRLRLGFPFDWGNAVGRDDWAQLKLLALRMSFFLTRDGSSGQDGIAWRR